MALARSRKRGRQEGDLESILELFEAQLAGAIQLRPPDPHALLLAIQRLQALQGTVEKRLEHCTIDSLTPHDVVEFIFGRRVRLVSIMKNDFGADVSTDDDDDDKSGSLSLAPGSKPVAAKTPPPFRRLLVHFQVGRERLVAECRAEGPRGDGSCYAFLVRLVQPHQALLLRCVSLDQSSGFVAWDEWEGFRTRLDLDKRPVVDFARGVVLVGMFGELRKRFGRQESDSEDEGPGLVSTLSVCGMMAAAMLPTSEGRLLEAHVATGQDPGSDDGDVDQQASARSRRRRMGIHTAPAAAAPTVEGSAAAEVPPAGRTEPTATTEAGAAEASVASGIASSNDKAGIIVN